MQSKLLSLVMFLVVWIVLMGMAALIGCAPSIRYTHSIPKKISPPKKLSSAPPKHIPHPPVTISESGFKELVDSYVGVPYAYAGLDRSGLDCSGLVLLVFREYKRMILPHSAGKQYGYGKVVSRIDARMGDLVFFKHKTLGYIDHVGIYMGDGRFVHASTNLGVMYDSLDDPYYRARFVGIRRIL